MKLTKENIKKVYKSKTSSIEKMQLLGYELITQLFVDSSGLGLENEMALTANQFETELQKLIETHKTVTTKVISQGQFQVYIGVFKKVAKSTAKKIAGNTYKLPNGDILYHDTIIIKHDTNGNKILNNGGFYTRTTKERINAHISPHYIYQKSFNWYVKKDNGEVVEFENGMTI